MNPEYEKQLEASVRRELAALEELQPSPALSNRIMRAIEQRGESPWYRRSWQTWPVAWQGVSLVALAMLFAGACFGAMELLQAASGSQAGHEVGRWFAWMEAVWKTVSVLKEAGATVIRQLEPE